MTSIIPSAVVTSPSDGDLLRFYVQSRRDQLFQQIVERHGPMVMAVAWRTLQNRHTAEDVFQATFLILARKADKIRRPESLAAWLHGVACRIAKRAQQQQHGQWAGSIVSEPAMTDNLIADLEAASERQALDEELQRLSPVAREALVLHYLQGLSQPQIAVQLGISPAAVDGRIRRGKHELQVRLARRGFGLAAGLAAVVQSQTLTASLLTPELLTATAASSSAIVAGTSLLTLLSANSIHLAAQETAMLTTGKVTAFVMTFMLVTMGGWLGTRGGHGGNADAFAETGVETRLPMDTTGRSTTAESTTAEIRFATETAARSSTSGPQLNLTLNLTSEDAPPEERGNEFPVHVTHVGNRSPQTARIRAALDQLLHAEFPGNPLHDVLRHLSNEHNIPILLDSSVLSEAGITGDEEVGLVVSGITLRSALKLLLQDVSGVKLDYLIRDEVLMVTTAVESEDTLETRIYNVSMFPEEDIVRLPEIVDRLQKHGKFTLDQLAIPFKGSLIVRQNASCHNELEELLNSLAVNHKRQATPVGPNGVQPR